MMATERTGTERAWLAGGAMTVALAMLVGWFMVVNPELNKASATGDEVTSTQDSNLFLQSQVSTLRDEAGRMGALVKQLGAASAALPATAGIDEFTRQLSSYAHSSHVTITSITVGSPTPTGSSGPAPQAAAAPQAAPAQAGAPAAAVAGQTYSIVVSVVSNGAATNQQSFLRLVQHGPRAALVTSAALAPPNGATSAGAPATLTTQLQVFVEPQSPQDQAALQKLLDAASTP